MSTYIRKKGYIIGERPLVCVPVVAEKKEEILAQVRKLAGERTQMIEWRIDWFEAADDKKQVLEILQTLQKVCESTLLLATYRSKKQGGEGILSQECVTELLLALAESGNADLLDAEYFELEQTQKLFQRIHESGTLIVASHHNFRETPSPEEMLGMLSQMQKSGADIVKLAVMPNRQTDVAGLLLATAQFKEQFPDTPLITMSMGSMGVVSRISGESFGSCVTFGAGAKASAPGQMGKKELAQVLQLLHQAITGGDANIYLIGFMGVGKSTVAGTLRQLCGMEIIDTDEELVRRAGMTIPEIFEKHGQEAFREMETVLFRELSETKNVIVSCGGGAILREENRRLMKQSGTVVQLTAKPETILERVRGDNNRPILEGRKNVPAIRALLDERREAYELARDVTVATDGRGTWDIAAEILEKIKERK